MVSKGLTNIYTVPLTFKRENKIVLNGGLCLSNICFSHLTSSREIFLHPDEHRYWNNLRHSKRKQSFLLGRYCAKHALAICYTDDLDLTTLCIEPGVFQQPVVHHLTYHPVQISISHTDNVGAAVAFPESHPMAIDIETIDVDKIPILATQLTIAEQKLSDQFSAPKATSFTLLWTIKEALSKILKCGFMVPFDILEIATLVPQEYFTISYFKNFHQYQAISFLFANTACSLVYPKKTRLNLDVATIQNIFARSSYA